MSTTNPTAVSRYRTMLCLLLLAAETAAAGIRSAAVVRDTRFTGRGNRHELLLEARLVADSGTLLRSVTLAPGGGASPGGAASPGAIARICIELIAPGREAVPLGDFRLRAGATRCRFGRGLRLPDSACLRIHADIAPAAVEGATAAVDLLEIRTDDGTFAPAIPHEGGREVLLCRRRLYAPGDYGSRNWRIPAIRALPDGSLLAVNDKRKFNEADLPEDIDIVSRRSTDNGHTWSEPTVIALGRGRKQGFGDPALAVTDDGQIVCVFVGGNHLWHSTIEDPIRSYVSRSRDGGRSWSTPEEFTSVLWGPEAVNPQCRDYTYSFFGSGNGTTLTQGPHKGRILFVAAMGPARSLNNHAVYSDDGGRTWQVSDIAYRGGDEAKIVELADGRLLMSVRRSGPRGYNISADGGATWGEQGLWPEMTTNACNGDMIRYPTAEGRGTLLLHSIPDSPARRNVSVYLSRDEGRTWGDPKVLCPYESVYSSLTVLPDGTIGIYLEENPTPAGCELWFMNFSLDWLTGKTDRQP